MKSDVDLLSKAVFAHIHNVGNGYPSLIFKRCYSYLIFSERLPYNLIL